MATDNPKVEYTLGLDHPGPLFTALAKAQAVFRAASKDKVNPHFRSRYADLPAILDACRDALAENGLCVIQSTSVEGSEMFLETTIGHTSGHSVTGRYLLSPVKRDPQGWGAAMTYARRFALSAMLNIVSDDMPDDDGETASGRGYTRQTSAPPVSAALTRPTIPAHVAAPRASQEVPDHLIPAAIDASLAQASPPFIEDAEPFGPNDAGPSSDRRKQKVTQKQIARLFAIGNAAIREGRWPEDQSEFPKQMLGIQHWNEMNVGQYDWVCDLLQHSTFADAHAKWVNVKATQP